MGIAVLIVDDSLFMRNMLKNLVLEAGARVVGEAGDGKEAIEKYKELKPDLVLMDIMMPVMDGLEALKNIMSFDNGAKVIMCTSVGQEKVAKKAARKARRKVKARKAPAKKAACPTHCASP